MEHYDLNLGMTNDDINLSAMQGNKIQREDKVVPTGNARDVPTLTRVVQTIFPLVRPLELFQVYQIFVRMFI